MMARPNWEYIRVDVLAPEHPKIEALSDRGFRALFTLWCTSGKLRTDGMVSAKKWGELPPRVRAELFASGLFEPDGKGAVIHDFVGPDGHQRSRAEIEAASTARTDKARKAANARWGREKSP